MMCEVFYSAWKRRIIFFASCVFLLVGFAFHVNAADNTQLESSPINKSSTIEGNGDPLEPVAGLSLNLTISSIHLFYALCRTFIERRFPK